MAMKSQPASLRMLCLSDASVQAIGAVNASKLPPQRRSTAAHS
jgi:hypothetical protein